jgi:hypothetical protein
MQGYDPDHGSLETFATFQLEKLAHPHTKPWSSYLSALTVTPKMKIPLFSIFQAASAEIEIKLDLGGTTSPALHKPPHTDVHLYLRENLRALLDQITGRSKLLLHLADPHSVNDAFRTWLISEALANSRIILALSCDTNQLPHLPALANVELLPIERLTPAQLSLAVNAAFDSNEFTPDFYSVLMNYTDGDPHRIALKLWNAVQNNLITYTGRWCIAPDVLVSDAWAREFEFNLRDALLALESELDSVVYRNMWRFLQTATLCHHTIPANLVLRSVGIADADADDYIDRIDNYLVTRERIFTDHGYKHPSFPHHLTYEFFNPIVRWIVLRLTPKAERQNCARAMLRTLRSTLPFVSNRETARLYLELAEHAEEPEQLSLYKQSLAWWISADQEDLLRDVLMRAIAEGRITSEVLWQALQGAKKRWPNYRTLVVLDAFETQAAGIPYDLVAECRLLRAELYYELGRFGEAQEIASEGDGTQYAGDYAILMGKCRSIAGGAEDALMHFEKALKLAEGDLQRTVTALQHIGFARYQLCEYEAAQNILESLLDPPYNGISVIGTLITLLRVLLNQQKAVDAERRLEELQSALELSGEAKARHHADALECAARLELLKGNVTNGAKILGAAQEAYERELGPRHPHMADIYARYAVDYLQAGEYRSALVNSLRALVVCTVNYGVNAPKTSILRVPWEGTLLLACISQNRMDRMESVKTFVEKTLISPYPDECEVIVQVLSAVGMS